MNFDATPVNINSILSIKKIYLIPRNQREFSWEKTQLEEFWQDITRNISLNNDEFSFNEYFIGTIVLAGTDSDKQLEIVDGQQRLSVITILLSLISREFRKLKEASLAEDIFKSYIVTVSSSLKRGSLDSKGQSLTEKIQRDTSKNYFKISFQSEEDLSNKPETIEEKKIRYAGLYFKKQLQKRLLCKLLIKKSNHSYSNEDYAFCLNALYNMITNYLKVVKISVDSEDDAYDIFEVLNARGINLSSIDLIKNKVFQSCTTTFPIDEAKQKWDDIVNKLAETDTNETISSYIRCWWLSNIGYVGEEQLYRSFKRAISEKPTILSPEEFLDKIHKDIDLYIKIIEPSTEHWPQSDQIDIYRALNAINIFNVSIPRPFILSLLRLRRDFPKRIPQKDLILVLKRIEDFHFKFNSVCKLRPSGIDSTYSVLAIKVNSIANKTQRQDLVKELSGLFERRLPNEKTFCSELNKRIHYSNKKNQQGKLIRYIFEKLERILSNTDEINTGAYSIEHILPQSINNKHYMGTLGNLLPIGYDINERCGNKLLIDKISVYRQSRMNIVKRFLNEIDAQVTDATEKGGDTSLCYDWNEDKIQKRTESLSSLIYSLFKP